MLLISIPLKGVAHKNMISLTSCKVLKILLNKDTGKMIFINQSRWSKFKTHKKLVIS